MSRCWCIQLLFNSTMCFYLLWFGTSQLLTAQHRWLNAELEYTNVGTSENIPNSYEPLPRNPSSEPVTLMELFQSQNRMNMLRWFQTFHQSGQTGFNYSHQVIISVMWCIVLLKKSYIYVYSWWYPAHFQQCYRTEKQMILLTTVKCIFYISHYQPLAPHAYYTCKWTSSFQCIYIAV